jgi:predicted MFS family arabinose efflux permease
MNTATAAGRPVMPRTLPRALLVGLMGFLTLVDLFAAQAILPSLAAHYRVGPGAMGFAVNASTFGMAVAGLAVSAVGRRLPQRAGIAAALALLALPTLALAVAPGLGSFLALRVAQGVLMATAFTLTMTYLAERGGPDDTAGALAAYVTGVVASNLVGRMVAGAANEVAGLPATFLLFAALNLAGAVLVALALVPSMKMAETCRPSAPAGAAIRQHLADGGLRGAFALGSLILFLFIGCFTYVNFELAREPIALSPMRLGSVYLVFLPALVVTPLAGRLVRAAGLRAVLAGAFALCLAGLALAALPALVPVLAGLALVGVGTFLAQAGATGYVGRRARSDRAAASGLYLAAYYLGGLAGAFALGRVYETAGWHACLAVLAACTAAALLMSRRLPEVAR